MDESSTKSSTSINWIAKVKHIRGRKETNLLGPQSSLVAYLFDQLVIAFDLCNGSLLQPIKKKIPILVLDALNICSAVFSNIHEILTKWIPNKWGEKEKAISTVG